MYTLGMWVPGTPEWIVIGLICLLIFGKRLPEVGRALGRSIVEFKKGIRSVQEEIDHAGDDEPLKPYDKRLGGNEEELRRLQEQGNAPGAVHRERAQAEPS